MKIGIGSDHGGYELKMHVIKFLKGAGHDVRDYGTHSKESCDYPMIGFEVAEAVSKGDVERGVLICKSGVGMVIIANKVRGIRAAACYDVELAKLSREHNNCNVAVIAANYADINKAAEILNVWISTKHEGGRHTRRVEQISEIEAKLKVGEHKPNDHNSHQLNSKGNSKK